MTSSVWYWVTPLFLMGIVVVDQVLDRPWSVLIGGTLDEIGHWLTAAILALALKAVRVTLSLWMVLIGAFVIDLDHIARWEGLIDPVTDTSRTGFHALITVWVVLLLAAVASDRAALALHSLAFGMATHLFRDMATGTVPLLWPIRDTLISFSYNAYLWMLTAAVAISVAHGLATTARRAFR